MPASRRRHSLLDLARTPVAFLILENRRADLQHGIDDAPRLFDVILASKESGVTRHGVAEHALVRFHLPRAGMTAGHNFRHLTFHRLAWTHDCGADGDCHLGTDPETHVVPGQDTVPEHGRRLSKSGEYLRASHRQVLPRANVKRNSLPTPRIDLQPQGGK